jgi:predicted amidophosphoribosyltransferase
MQSAVKKFENTLEKGRSPGAKPTMSSTLTHFLLCPTCSRSVPASTAEKYCPNDGTKLLERCPCCDRPILTPFARFCAGCGQEFAKISSTALSGTPSTLFQENHAKS